MSVRPINNIPDHCNYTYIGQEKKNFGSGQLIFENWSGGPVTFFFKTTMKIFQI